ncbi:MAG: hypothetical protein Q9166_003254 [cf. Caloplaca sp. 2 TL-2023]
MPRISLYPRSFGVFLLFSISAPLPLRLYDGASTRGFISGKPPSDNEPTIHVTLDHGKSMVRKSEPLSHLVTSNNTLIKRKVSDHFKCLVRKAKVYIDQGIVPAVGHIELNEAGGPTPHWTKSDIKTFGWRSTESTGTLFNDIWNEAFRMMPCRFLDKKGVRQVYMLQNSDSKNEHDSPWKVLDESDILKRVPPVHRLPDVLWYNWEKIVPASQSTLRYYAVQGIDPGSTPGALIDLILQQRRGTINVPWAKRITFDISSDEGLALWAFPNSIALNWLWIHHGTVLGKRRPDSMIVNPGGV